MKRHYILFIGIAFICGVFLAAFALFASLPHTLLGAVSLILFLLLALSSKRDFLFTAFLFLLIFFLGVLRYNAFNIIQRDNIKNYTFRSRGKVLVQGKVASDPEEDGSTSSPSSGKKRTFILETRAIRQSGHWLPASGFALVNLYGREEFAFRYGDIVVLEGTLRRPFSYKRDANFDYREYLANKRIYSILNVKKGSFAKKLGEDEKIRAQITRGIYSIRAGLESHIEAYLEAPQSSVLEAILLGKRRKITPALTDLFAKTGTLHILAISGLHVGIIYFALRVILRIFRVRKKLSIILSVLFLICYAVLTGARPSILRATTMFSILGFGEILKRKISVFNLIGLSCLIVLMVNPNQIFDVGFIFSYAAVLSIICVTPLFYRVFSVGNIGKQGRVRFYVLRSLSVSLAAWVGILPLIAYYFGLISPVVVIANLIVIPLTFMIMGSGILFVSLGFLSKFLAAAFSESAWFFISMLIQSVKFLKDIPLSYFEINSPPLICIILYYIVLLAAVLVTRK